MSKKVCLDKRWKEIVFAAAGFGPNLLMVLMMAYFTDAVIPTGLNADINFWSYGGTTIVATGIFTILWTLSRCFDGIVDVPLAALTDTLKTKTGKRFITIAVSFIPMIISFALCWIPVFGKSDLSQGQMIGNSIWIIFWALVFFATYTLALITFYGSLSEVCTNQTQRARVSAYKSVFDTISYALVYAAIPAIFKAVGVPIWKVALFGTPLMITILIPLLLTKKVENTEEQVSEENVPIGTSILLTVKSRPFMKWLAVNCVGFFGLQMFLVSQNTLISGVMNLGAGYASILNTCAFAPVPLMLYFFNKLRKKSGIRVAYQSCLLCFAISIFSFNLGSQYFWGDNTLVKLLFGCVGGVAGSWAIGGFFMVPYLIPTVIASVEEEATKKDHSAMYFAVQALATSIVGAIASSLIYNYLKQWTMDAGDFSMKCGVSMVPFIVSLACIIGFFLCFKMPKKYTAAVIWNDIKTSLERENARINRKKEREILLRDNKIKSINALNILQQEKDVLIEELNKKVDLTLAKYSMQIAKNDEILAQHFNEEHSSAGEEKTQQVGIAANICLFFLSVSIFGIVDRINISKRLKSVGINLTKSEKILMILSFFIPFVSLFYDLKIYKKVSDNKKAFPAIIITSLFLPLWMDFVSNAIINAKINKMN